MSKFTDMIDSKGNPKIAPVQGYAPGIPWSLHLEAYDAYCKKWSKQEALIDLEGRYCRGGFSVAELDGFVPGWRDKVSEIGKLRAEVAELRAALAAQYRELSNLVEMQPGGALHQPPTPVGYVFGNSYFEVGNPRLTDEIKRLGKARYGDPQASSAPVAPDERAAFEAWKGYELPALNNHGQFHQDWLHREFVAFKAGQARAALSVQAEQKPFAYFVQSSGFGPYIECKSDQDGAFAAYRVAAPTPPTTGEA